MQLIVYLFSVSLRLLELKLCVSTTTKKNHLFHCMLFCEKYVQTYSILNVIHLNTSGVLFLIVTLAVAMDKRSAVLTEWNELDILMASL
jgi:hypothetical protein